MQEENQSKIRALSQIIREGDVIEQFLSSEAWSILRRTLHAIVDRNKSEAFDYAKNSDKEIRYFLGKFEQAEEVIRIIELDFLSRRGHAIDEKIMTEELDKDQAEQDKLVHDQVAQAPYIGQRPGLMGG